jgi:D-alanine transaminase
VTLDSGFGYLNGEFSELKNLKITAMDRGFIYGDGCYEVIPIYHKKPFGLEEHLNRLLCSLEKVRIPLILININ